MRSRIRQRPILLFVPHNNLAVPVHPNRHNNSRPERSRPVRLRDVHLVRLDHPHRALRRPVLREPLHRVVILLRMLLPS